MSEEARIPPQAIEVEESILGAMMIDSEAADIAVGLIREDDLYKPAHKEIYKVFLELYEQGQSIDVITVESMIKDLGKLDVIGGPEYLADLTRSVSSAANIDYHCHIVREKAIRRNLIQKLSIIQQECYDASSDTYEVLDRAQESVFSIVDAGGDYMRSLAETLHMVVTDVERIQAQGKPIGLRTGLDIDQVLQGFQDSKLYFIGARPSMGKTALVMTIMRRLARDNHPAGILSMETSDKALAMRLIAQVSDIPVDKLVSGNMNEQEINRFYEACNDLKKLGIYIDDEPALSAQKVRSKCRLMVKRGVKIIFIDFLQLMHGEGRTKHEEIGNITKTLKQIAKELNIPIVALSQLSRKVEDRNDKRPQLADLRESGSIEEDADCIFFLYRPEYYGVTTTTEGHSTDGLAEVIIAKNKDGKTGVKSLRFIAESMRFENHEFRHVEPDQPHHVPASDMDLKDEESFF